MQGGYRLLASLMPLAAQSPGQQTRQYKKVYVKPSHQRVIQQKEAKKKLNRRKFKSMMYWVMQAKSRGF
ncbi:hypothetical protein WJX79_007609 [Trebouxia sp. C0005]